MLLNNIELPLIEQGPAKKTTLDNAHQKMCCNCKETKLVLNLQGNFMCHSAQCSGAVHNYANWKDTKFLLWHVHNDVLSQPHPTGSPQSSGFLNAMRYKFIMVEMDMNQITQIRKVINLLLKRATSFSPKRRVLESLMILTSWCFHCPQRVSVSCLQNHQIEIY